MKRIISLITTVTLVAVLTSTLTLTSCKKDGQSLNSGNTSSLSTSTDNNSGGAPLKVKSILMYNKVVDANGLPPVGNATLLFDAVGNAPVTAPRWSSDYAG